MNNSYYCHLHLKPTGSEISNLDLCVQSSCWIAQTKKLYFSMNEVNSELINKISYNTYLLKNKDILSTNEANAISKLA